MALMLPPPKRRNRVASLAEAMLKSMVVQPVSDAKWSLSHPMDRLQGRGRASHQNMEIPFFKFPPKSIASDLGEGFELRRVPHLGTTKDYHGLEYPFEKPPKGTRGVGVAYNLHAPDNEIVGSVNYLLSKDSNFVDTLWVDPRFRKTKAFQELATIPMRHNKRITAAIVNERLAQVFNKWQKRQPKSVHPTNVLLDDVMEAGLRGPGGRRIVGRPLPPREHISPPPAHPATVGQAQGNARFMQPFNRSTNEVEVAQRIHQATRQPARPMPAPSHQYLARTPLFREPFRPVFNPRRRSGV